MMATTTGTALILLAALGLSIGYPATANAQAQSAVQNTAPPQYSAFDLPACLLAAQNGDLDAQLRMADFYSRNTNRPVELNYKRAIEWFTRASEQQSALAFFRLGQMHQHGTGCAVDPILGNEFYKKAAGLGDNNAKYALGRAYWYGIGAVVNYQTAISWYTSAARMGHSKSQLELGKIYMDERGPTVNMATDPVTAYAWLSMAAGSLSPMQKEAEYELAACRMHMSLSQVMEAEAKALTPDEVIGAALPVLPVEQQINNAKGDRQ